MGYKADPNFFDHVYNPEPYEREGDRNKKAVEEFREKIERSIAAAKAQRMKLIESSSGCTTKLMSDRHNSIIGTLRFLEKQQMITLHELDRLLEAWNENDRRNTK